MNSQHSNKPKACALVQMLLFSMFYPRGKFTDETRGCAPPTTVGMYVFSTVSLLSSSCTIY